MRKSKKDKPPSIKLPNTSTQSSPRTSSVYSDWDADDEGFMSSSDMPSRPVSMALPSGAYGHRRPNLQEVLANTAPAPWTLSAFTAYLSQNHCLETLEFTTDATRYKKHYMRTIEGEIDAPASPSSEDLEHFRSLWQKLMDAYIRPSGSREVNLPSNVRDRLLALPNTDRPPHPSELDDAVRKIYQLMDDSVLASFLDSMPAPRSLQKSSSHGHTKSSDGRRANQPLAASYNPRTISPTQSRPPRSQTPPNKKSAPSDVLTPRSPPQRFTQPTHLNASLSRGSRQSANLSSSSMSDPQDASLTDDSTSSLSPTSSTVEPTTPPMTPPTSDADFGTSPKNSRGDGWKKMGAKLGFGKPRSLSSSSVPISGRYPIRIGRESAVEEEEDNAL